MKKILSVLIDENPLFVLCLGILPALAVTTTFEIGYLMGLSVLIVLILSNISISLLSKFINEKIRIPIFIIIIAIFVTILDIVLNTYIEPLSKTLGIYLPLIVVNCMIMSRTLLYASNHKMIDSIKDAFKMGAAYTLVLSAIGLIREVLGNNTITIMDKTSDLTGYVMKYQILPMNDFIPNVIFLTPAGAFLILGLALGIFNALKKGESK